MENMQTPQTGNLLTVRQQYQHTYVLLRESSVVFFVFGANMKGWKHNLRQSPV